MVEGKVSNDGNRDQIYVCERCGYENDKKGNFQRHLYRKFTCLPSKKNIDIEILREKFKNENQNERIKKIEKLQKNKRKFIPQESCICDCGNIYTTIGNLTRHQKKCDIFQDIIKKENPIFVDQLGQSKRKPVYKGKNDTDSEKTNANDSERFEDDRSEFSFMSNKSYNSSKSYYTEFSDNSGSTIKSKIYLKNKKKIDVSGENTKESLIEMVRLLNEQLENQSKKIDDLVSQQKNKPTTVNNITNNYQYNIQINAYSNTSIDHLTNRDFYKALCKCVLAVPDLIQKIHYNPMKPENHNVFIKDINRGQAMVFDGEKWVLKDGDEIVEELVRDNEFRFQDWIKDKNRKNHPKTIDKYEKFQEKKVEEGAPEQVRKEVKMLLYNNRSILHNLLQYQQEVLGVKTNEIDGKDSDELQNKVKFSEEFEKNIREMNIVSNIC